MSWELIELEIKELKLAFQNQTKRAIKRNPPKNIETRRSIATNLIELYNQFQAILNKNWSALKDENKNTIRTEHKYFRDRLVLAFFHLKLRVNVPLKLGELAGPNIDEEVQEASEDESNEENISEEENTGEEEEERLEMDEDEFVNRATRKLGDFDGSAKNLQSFLDGIALIERSAANFQEAAVLVIKSKLKGNCRRLISNENTVAAVVATLTNRIQMDSAQVITAKIKNLKQSGKNAQTYMSDLEKLTEELENVHLSKNIPPDTARSLALETAIESVKTNSTSKDVKQAMITGNIDSMNKLVTTFVSVTNELPQSSSVNYYRRRGNNYNFSYNTGRGRANRFHYSGNWNNRGRGNRNQGNNRNFQNVNRNNNQNRNVPNRNNNNNNRNARYAQGNAENPQQANLGDN